MLIFVCFNGHHFTSAGLTSSTVNTLSNIFGPYIQNLEMCFALRVYIEYMVQKCWTKVWTVETSLKRLLGSKGEPGATTLQNLRIKEL
jgi:hypothetical protein